MPLLRSWKLSTFTDSSPVWLVMTAPSTPPMSPPALHVPDTVTIDVGPGTIVIITSDLHFAALRTEASAWAEMEISQALEAVEGPGIYVMAGDVFELWAGVEPTTKAAMDAHP